MDTTIKLEDVPIIVKSMEEKLKHKGYAEISIHEISLSVYALSRFMAEQGLEYYPVDNSLSFADEFCKLRNHTDHSASMFRSHIQRFNDYACGRGHIKKHIDPALPCLEGYIESLNMFLEECESRKLSENTVYRKRSSLTPFLEGLVKSNCSRLEHINPEAINQALFYTKSTAWAEIRRYLKFLVRKGLIDRDYSLIIPKRPLEFKLPSVYTEEELATILASIDRNTSSGKMDYCILLMASRLGMRVGDIVRLRISNVSLDKRRISWISQKTGEPMDLYIAPDMAEAIRDYIENARPKSENDHLFFSLRAPFDPMTRTSVNYRVRKYLALAGIDIRNRHMGPHSFRSSIDSGMVNNDESYDTVRKINGHRSDEAIKHYVVLDLNKLRMCAAEVPKPTGYFQRFLNMEAAL